MGQWISDHSHSSLGSQSVPYVEGPCLPEVLLVQVQQHIQAHPVLLEGDGVVGGRVRGDARAEEEPHPLLGARHPPASRPDRCLGAFPSCQLSNYPQIHY